MADAPIQTLAEIHHRAGSLGREPFVRKFDVPFLVEVGSRNPLSEAPQFGTMVGIRTSGDSVFPGDEEITGTCPVYRLVKRGVVFPDKVTVGRSSNNDIVLDDLTVSKLHAYFTFEKGRVYLTDAESKNGSTVEKKRLVALKKAECPNGGLIGFGPKRRFLFMEPSTFFDAMKRAMGDY